MKNEDYTKDIEVYGKKLKELFLQVNDKKKYKDISSGIVFEQDSNEYEIGSARSEFDCLLSRIRQNDYVNSKDKEKAEELYNKVKNLFSKIDWEK